MDTHPTPMGSPTPPPPQKIVLVQPGGWFGRLGKLLWIALVISIVANISQKAAYDSYFEPTTAQISEKYHSLSKHADDKIAVIRVSGAIMSADGYIKRQIDQVRKDKKVKAVVLRVDSPGGTVTASDYLYHHMKQMIEEREIPLVVSMGSLCASGGYYIAMASGDQEDAIYAEPTTWTGSIGVVIPHYDLSGLLESWNVTDDSIVSDKFKQLGSPTRKLNDADRAEERQVLQTMVDLSFARFKEIVLAGRPGLRDNAEGLKAVTTGQVFTAGQARENGLVDQIGFLEDAIERAIELANLDKDEVRVVKYTRHVPGLLESLSGTQARSGSSLGLGLETLLDLAAPRAYYLCTTLPSMLSNTRP